MPNLYSQAKGVAGIGDEDVQAGSSIAENIKTMQQLNGANASTPAAKPAAPAAPTKPSPKDLIKPSAKYGDRSGEKRIDVSKWVSGSFKKGGKVKKTGIYKLHAKERVLNTKQTAKVAKKGGLAALLGGKA